MSETISTIRKDGLRPELSLAAAGVANLIDNYEETLANDNLFSYRNEDDLSKKIDMALVDFMQPERLNMPAKAVSLKSWQIVLSIERHYEQANISEDWSYWMFLTGSSDFWKRVHPTTDAYLKKVIKSNHGIYNIPSLSYHDAEQSLTEHLLLSNSDRKLIRREWHYPNGDPYQVLYAVKAN